MTAARCSIRAEVMAELAAFIRTANEHGEDGFNSAHKAFPKVPTQVITEAWMVVECEIEAAWWESVERTIDGEIIKNALVCS